MTVSRCTCVGWDVAGRSAGRPAGRRLSRRTIYAAYLRPMSMRAHDGREEPASHGLSLGSSLSLSFSLSLGQCLGLVLRLRRLRLDEKRDFEFIHSRRDRSSRLAGKEEIRGSRGQL